MPTYKDPAVDAEQTREALRGLAHATHSMSDPGDTYKVLGSLSAALLSLQQSLDQLAGLHERYALQATVEGDSRAGRRDALAAGEHLREAAGSVRKAHGELRAAFNHNGQIAWRQGIDLRLSGHVAHSAGRGAVTPEAGLAGR
jgi:hypothetical protein